MIQGRYGAANTVAFTVTIDAATGNVTLTQLESLRHPTGGLASPDEPVSLAAGSLQAVLSITDGDGDIARATADLGGVLTFEDDAPTAALAVNAGATVIVDETLGQNPGEAAVGLGQVTVLGTTLFTSSTTTGQDNEGATSGVLAVDCRRRTDQPVLDGQPGDHAVRRWRRSDPGPLWRSQHGCVHGHDRRRDRQRDADAAGIAAASDRRACEPGRARVACGGIAAGGAVDHGRRWRHRACDGRSRRCPHV